MEKMPATSTETLLAFAGVAPGGPEAVQRKMFGMESAFVHGNMFMGLFGDDFHVRLSPYDRAEVLALGGRPFAPGGRAMKEYVVLPAAVVADEAALRGWVDRAYAFGATLPVKAPKPRTKPAARGNGSPPNDSQKRRGPAGLAGPRWFIRRARLQARVSCLEGCPTPRATCRAAPCGAGRAG